MSNDQAYAGFGDLGSGSSEWNRLDFAIRSIAGKMATATLVRVEAVSGQSVDIKPIVSQVDGAGNAVEHGVIHNVPVWRLQGGGSAVIVDPAKGDIGLAIFAHSDISSAKKNKGPSTPGSLRKFDWADAIYLGGLLNADPEQFVKLAPDGITIQTNALKLDGTGSVMIVSPDVSTSASFKAGNGATGTFTSQDGKTVTVVKGIITAIV